MSNESKAENFQECDVPLVLSSTSDWYPYLYQQGKQSLGVDVELLKQILSKMQCQLKVVHFPERRSLFELSSGNFDIGLGASFTKERHKKFDFSLPYRFEKNRFVYRASDNTLENINGLTEIIAAKKVIAVNLAGWYGHEFEQAKTQYDGFIFSDTVAKRLKMLAYNRVDVVVDDDIVLCSELARSEFPELVMHPLIISSADIHFIFNRKRISPSFVRQFNQILSEMKKSSELEQLYQNQLPSNCINPSF
ncbi:transporter substrate-binding domain-containing protein [Thalassotalea sp. G2M2-11]|uniref:substrate-binding periplasmic protein n=1 Tax=Thalassotalea sp. G2M2-11 TaxID=2787627 RepID=UPI0019CF904B|nr:transporter substrate-binding domain-containing protein [Thalassotalea sp. G2M2-11]